MPKSWQAQKWNSKILPAIYYKYVAYNKEAMDIRARLVCDSVSIRG